MRTLGIALKGVTIMTVLTWGAAAVDPAPRDFTCFQVSPGYSPELDIGSDIAVVYGTSPTLGARIQSWREQGYGISYMTGIAWGGYDDYYMTPDGFKKDEVQTTRTGRLYMHGDSTTVGYNVPTDPYIEYIKKVIEPAVDAGALALYLEEPEYWAETGWSEAFKKEWERFYGEPWRAPNSSVDAQYQASRLKYELYFKALREVFKHAKARAAAQGRTVECHVPTHSLVNYAQWRIVSPESHLMDLAEADGYIAQVWTGTSRSKNMYRGEMKERTFETAYLEYAQMLGMVRPTGRKVWFLADPIEDNPNYSWNNYKLNYECTIIASVMFPEVSRFEVMPWPDRIFRGTYPKVDLDAKSGEREGIPAAYATQLLVVINALNDMQQEDVEYFAGSRGIGLAVSDTLMFQRAEPHPSDAHLGSFFGLAMPLVKHGVPVEIVQIENLLHPEALVTCKVLLLTYEGQKPLKPEYHEALAQWVRAGGCLIYVGDGTDPYNHVREWWNEQGKNDANPEDHLFQTLGISRKAHSEPEAIGQGYVRVFDEKPRQLQRYDYGAGKVIELVAAMCALRGEPLRTQHYLGLRRGPYRLYSVLDESVSPEPLTVSGSLVDLFDAALPCITAKTLAPNERTLLYDLDWARAHGATAKVVACGGRVRNEQLADGALTFAVRGPKGTTGCARVMLPRPPTSVKVTPESAIDQAWDAASGTLRLTFPNLAQDLAFEVWF